MVDDELYGLVSIAFELSIPFSDLLDMPYAELQLWSAFFSRRTSERELARKTRQGR